MGALDEPPALTPLGDRGDVEDARGEVAEPAPKRIKGLLGRCPCLRFSSRGEGSRASRRKPLLLWWCPWWCPRLRGDGEGERAKELTAPAPAPVGRLLL